jgi:hypothetical protein
MTTKISIKNAAGALVGMWFCDECYVDGSLTAFQRIIDADMPGHVVSYATPDEIRHFQPGWVN